MKQDQGADHGLGGALGIDVLRRVAAVIFKWQNHEGRALFCDCPAISRSPGLEQKGRPQQSDHQHGREGEKTRQKAWPLLKRRA